MPWEKQPAIAGKIVGCLCCGGNKEVYPLDRFFAVGFGASWVSRDGETVYAEGPNDDHIPVLQQFEDMAAADPDHDWRMCRRGPLRDADYQRHDTGKWVLIREGEGFA